MEFITAKDLIPLIPEIILSVAALLVMMVDLFAPKEHRTNTLVIATLGAFALALIAELQLYGMNASGFYGTVVADGYSILFESIYLVVGCLTVLLSRQYLADQRMNYGEYYVLLLCSVIGMMFMTSSLELLVIFIGLEIMSISSYILVGMRRGEARSSEAALKYLLLGAFSTGFLLYGISLLYGATGSTVIPEIIYTLNQPGGASNPLAIVGVSLIIISVGFKVAVVPFHMWTPDVYTGAPTPVTGFMSAAAKAAGFAMLVRILLTGVPLEAEQWSNLLWIISVLTMTVGNLMALQQSSVKRMLAYSSIAHAGYVMVAVTVGTSSALSGILFYSCAYAIMGTGAFGILTIPCKGKTPDTFEDLAGYAKQRPFLAFLMTLFMLSLIGLPLTGGFVGKLQIFSAALEEGWVWLTIIGVLNSGLSVYYYLRVVVYVYMRESETTEEAPEAQTSGFAVAGLIGSAIAVLYLGVFPETFLELAALSIRGL
jgi:NADH-quinone oxidoreductase subunit N